MENINDIPDEAKNLNCALWIGKEKKLSYIVAEKLAELQVQKLLPGGVIMR